jgi:hypothetical protein
MTSETDEDRWAEAQSLLDRTPTESAEQRVRRWRRLAILSVVAIAVLSLAVFAVLIAWTDDVPRGTDDVPLWQEIAGFAVQLIATVVLVRVFVLQWRANRRRMGWRSPLVALTRRQRRELLVQVKRGGSVPPERLPLARHLAETVAGQRVVIVLLLGLLLQAVGRLLASPSRWNMIYVPAFGAVILVSLPFVLRNIRRARRFLDAHPAPADSLP